MLPDVRCYEPEEAILSWSVDAAGAYVVHGNTSFNTPFNTPFQYTLSMHPFNTPLKYNLSIHPFNALPWSITTPSNLHPILCRLVIPTNQPIYRIRPQARLHSSSDARRRTTTTVHQTNPYSIVLCPIDAVCGCRGQEAPCHTYASQSVHPPRRTCGYRRRYIAYQRTTGLRWNFGSQRLRNHASVSDGPLLTYPIVVELFLEWASIESVAKQDIARGDNPP